MLNIRNKKGFVLLMWVIVIMMFSLLMASAIYAFLGYLMRLLQEQALMYQGFYYAEFGIYRGKWLLDGNYVGEHAEEVPIDLDNDGTPELVAPMRLQNPTLIPHDYLIVVFKVEPPPSTPSGEKLRIIAHYVNGEIVAWDRPPFSL